MVANQNKLATLFNIHPGEGRLVTLLLAYSFFIGAARIFTRSAAMGLFLSQYSAGELPYVYIGISVIVTALSYVYLRLGQKLTLSRLLAVTLIFLLASLLLFWGGLSISQSGTLVFILPIWYEVLWTLTSLAFWNLAGRLLNVRQGKRLFAFVNSGEAVSILLGGLLVPVLVQIGSTTDLLLAAAASVFCILLILGAISRSFSHQLDLPLEKASTEAAGSAKTVFKSHYVLLLCSLFGIVVLVYFFIDAIFYAQAEIRYPTQESLTAFVGVFFGVIGFLGLLTRLFVVGWLIDRFGVRITALVGPVVIATLVALLALAGTFSTLLLVIFGLASLTKMFNLLLFDSTDIAAINIFYQPLSPARRTQVQTLVEGIVYPLAVGLAGVGLVLLTTILNLGILPVVYITFFLVLVWLAFVVVTGRNYPAVLRQALVKRKISGEGLVLDDESSRKVLLGALQSNKPETVLHALTMLEESESVDLADALPRLLNHPSSEVRLAALRVIERQNVTTALEAVQNCMQNEPELSVRAVALRVLASLGQDDAIEGIYPYLEDDNLQIRSEAIVALLCYTSIEVAIMAEGKLLQLAMSNNPTERITAAKIVGRVTGRNLDQLLTQLLKDENIQVRRAALAAAGQGNYPNVWPLVIEQVASPQLRNAAAAALVSGGVSTLPHIGAAFDDSTQCTDTRCRLARVVGRIGGSEATAILCRHLEHPNLQVRTEVFAALHRCGYRAASEEHVAVVAQINTEAEQATETLAGLVDFQQHVDENNPGFSLLADALGREMLQSCHRIFWLLSFIYPTTTILQASYNLGLGVPEKRAYALEVLDLTLSSNLRALLFPFFEDISPRQQLQQLGKTFPQSTQTTEQRLRTMMSCSPDHCNHWMQACAAYTAGQPEQISGSLLESLLLLVQADITNPLVRETAQFVLAACRNSAAVVWEEYRASAQFKNAFAQMDANYTGGNLMLSTIEKVLILKTVNLFSGTPDEILAEVAALLEEVELLAGNSAFAKGDPGDCMYIIISGKVKAHDGDHIFNTLQDGDVFGEMAVLDPEPRVASITTLEDTNLLRLDQEPFYELMEDRIEIARGVIHVLSGHLRNRVGDVAELKEQLQLVEQR